MKTMYVYILLCSDNSYYVGVTNNLERRLNQHEQGINPLSYTHSRRPVKLVFYEMFTSPEKAIQFEKKIKKWSRVKKEALINKNYELLPLLSKKGLIPKLIQHFSIPVRPAGGLSLRSNSK